MATKPVPPYNLDQHTRWQSDEIDKQYGAFGEPGSLVPDGGNLLSSLSKDGKHRIVLDIDVPVHIEPSTNGGAHIFIDVPLSWGRYLELLEALCQAGVIEYGYYTASREKAMSQVRAPGVPKPTHYADTGAPWNHDGDSEAEAIQREANPVRKPLAF